MSQNKIDPSVISPDTAYRSGLNFITENSDRRNLSGTSSLSSLTGQIRGAAAPIIENDVISQMWAFCSVAGTAVTSTIIAAYDRQFNLVAQTANVFGQLAVNTWVGGPVATNWQSPYTGVVYLGVFAIAGTTQPTFLGPTGLTGSNDPPVSGIGRSNFFLSSVTLPTTLSLGGPVTNTIYVMAA